MKLKKIFSTCIALAGLALANNAMAVVDLTLTSTDTNNLGPQSTSNPCIIAATTCQQPAGMDYTNFQQSGNISSHNEDSPTYTVGQLTGFVGSAFDVAIDVNTTQAAGETLEFFGVYVNGALEFQYQGPTLIGEISNNGNGYGDWVLSRVDLSGFASDATVVFNAQWSGASDGGESFFIINGEGGTVPEPGTALLLGMGLLGMTALRRRRITRS